MKRPEILLLDLGNVVFGLDWQKPIQILQLENSKLEKILLNQIQTWGPYDQYERGRLSTEDFLAFVNQHSEKKIEKKEFAAAWCALISGYITGMAELIETLSKDIPLYALTNTNPLHYHHILSEFEGMKFFREIFSSVGTGFRKPEREIFEVVLDRLNFKPEEILYIDDNIGHIETAKKLGFSAEVYNGNTALDLKRLLWKYKVPTP